jgi:hypothetical protein
VRKMDRSPSSSRCQPAEHELTVARYLRLHQNGISFDRAPSTLTTEERPHRIPGRRVTRATITVPVCRATRRTTLPKQK